MNRIIAWFKNIQIDRIVTAFLVGILLVVSTACSDGASAKTADDVRKEVPSSAVTNEYKGGMNDYSDVDPRQDTKGSQAKAKALLDNAQKNIDNKSVDSGEQYVENYRNGTPLGERVRRIGENLGESAKEVTEGVSKGTQRGVDNIKGNTQDAAKDVAHSSQKAGEAAKSKVKSDINATQRALDKAAASGERFGDNVKQSARDAAKSLD